MALIAWHTSLGEASGFEAVPSMAGNLLHVPAAGALALWLALACGPERGWRRRLSAANWPARRAFGLWALVVLHGFANETHQFVTPGRTTSLYDVFLEGLGGAALLAVPFAALPRGGRAWGWPLALLAAALALGLHGASGARDPLDRSLFSLLALVLEPA